MLAKHVAKTVSLQAGRSILQQKGIECAFKLLGLSASGKIKTVQGNMFEFGRFFSF
jgi:hypothetical protein